MVEQEPVQSRWNVRINCVDGKDVYFEKIKKSQVDDIIKGVRDRKYYHQFSDTGQTLVMSAHVINIYVKIVTDEGDAV